MCKENVTTHHPSVCRWATQSISESTVLTQNQGKHPLPAHSCFPPLNHAKHSVLRLCINILLCICLLCSPQCFRAIPLCIRTEYSTVSSKWRFCWGWQGHLHFHVCKIGTVENISEDHRAWASREPNSVPSPTVQMILTGLLLDAEELAGR